MSTTTYPDFYHPPKFVLQEEISPLLFTGREETLRRLWDWAMSIDRMLADSLALMSPRRYGKSALLVRLFNVMFACQDRVAPFYIHLSESDWTKGDFADRYFLTFLKHFCAFFLRDDEVLAAPALTNLHELLSRHSTDWLPRILRSIEAYQQIGEGIEHWDKKMRFAQEAPNDLCAITGKKCLVIFDEFQDLNRRVYRDFPLTRPDENLTGAYRSLALSKVAPMLVAGSMLTMLSRIVFSGALYGRFRPVSLPLLSESESEELMDKLTAVYQVTTTPAVKNYLFALTKGNPYYLTQLVNNPMTRDLSTKENVDAVYREETTSFRTGQLYQMWWLHFEENMDLLNDDQHGKRLLYYILDKTENDGVEQIPQKQIAAALNIPLAKVAELVKKLEAADLLEMAGQSGMAAGLKDTVMLDCLRHRFYADLEDLAGPAAPEVTMQQNVKWLWQEIARINGSLKYFYGVKGEEQIRERMASWQGEWAEGSPFGAAEKIFLPRFDPASFNSINLRQLGLAPGEIDIYAEYTDAQGRRCAWAVEVRRQNRPVTLPEAAKFQQKLETLQPHKNLAALQGWMVSQYGFSKNAAAFLAQKGIYYSVIPRE